MGRSKTLFTLVALLGLTTVVLGETKYVSVMSKVTWGKCRSHVWKALTETFKATRVRIKTGEDDKQIVTFISKDKTITRTKVDKAVNALNFSGKPYLVWTVKKEE